MTWVGQGARTWVAPVSAADIPGLRAGRLASVEAITTWGPALENLENLVAGQGPDRRTFVVHARTPLGPHDIVARVNLNHTVPGRMSSTTLGYDAYAPYAGQGLLREGLALLLDHCFTVEPPGLGLHRVEAGVQPANVRSGGLLRSLGFQREGFAPRLVHLPTLGEQGEDWRDHDVYALRAEDWPGSAQLDRIAYRPADPRRVVVVVNGLPGSGKSTLSTHLARELQLPLYRKDVVKESCADVLAARLPAATAGRDLGGAASEVLWSLLAESPVGGVVESWLPVARDRDLVAAGLRRAGLDPARVPEIWCDVPMELARARDAARWEAGARHTVHRAIPDAEWRGLSAAGPLALGPVLRVDTRERLTDRQVCRVALTVRALR